MLQVHSFTFNPFQENTYLIVNDQSSCWIVDPGMYDTEETNRLSSYIAAKGLKPRAVINTHTHLDHIFGVQWCKNQYQIPFLMHERDLPVLQGAKGSAMLFGFQFTDIPQPDDFIHENHPLSLEEEQLQVRFTPGHSPGSIVFFHEQGGWVIGGDVLFNGSIGRTDLPGGNFDMLIQSIKTELFSLPDNIVVHPGHGPSTTIGHEKLTNPFLQDI